MPAVCLAVLIVTFIPEDVIFCIARFLPSGFLIKKSLAEPLGRISISFESVSFTSVSEIATARRSSNVVSSANSSLGGVFSPSSGATIEISSVKNSLSSPSLSTARTAT